MKKVLKIALGVGMGVPTISLIIFSTIGVIFLANQVGLLEDDELTGFSIVTDSSSSGGTVSGFQQYYQGDYSNVSYGSGTIATCGCGPTSFAMVASTISGTKITPEDAVSWCGNRYYQSGAGTVWEYFSAAKENFELNCTLTTTTSIDEVYTALKDGALVISSQGAGLFTQGGHFIVLAGVYDDGGIIVRDPNKKNAVTKEYNSRSFTKSEINEAAKNYWIFKT